MISCLHEVREDWLPYNSCRGQTWTINSRLLASSHSGENSSTSPKVQSKALKERVRSKKWWKTHYGNLFKWTDSIIPCAAVGAFEISWCLSNTYTELAGNGLSGISLASSGYLAGICHGIVIVMSVSITSNVRALSEGSALSYGKWRGRDIQNFTEQWCDHTLIPVLELDISACGVLSTL